MRSAELGVRKRRNDDTGSTRMIQGITSFFFPCEGESGVGLLTFCCSGWFGLCLVQHLTKSTDHGSCELRTPRPDRTARAPCTSRSRVEESSPRVAAPDGIQGPTGRGQPTACARDPRVGPAGRRPPPAARWSRRPPDGRPTKAAHRQARQARLGETPHRAGVGRHPPHLLPVPAAFPAEFLDATQHEVEGEEQYPQQRDRHPLGHHITCGRTVLVCARRTVRLCAEFSHNR